MSSRRDSVSWLLIYCSLISLSMIVLYFILCIFRNYLQWTFLSLHRCATIFTAWWRPRSHWFIHYKHDCWHFTSFHDHILFRWMGLEYLVGNDNAKRGEWVFLFGIKVAELVDLEFIHNCSVLWMQERGGRTLIADFYSFSLWILEKRRRIRRAEKLREEDEFMKQKEDLPGMGAKTKDVEKGII